MTGVDTGNYFYLIPNDQDRMCQLMIERPREAFDRTCTGREAVAKNATLKTRHEASKFRALLVTVTNR